ncbi:MAG: Arc family DNA-binding protein [Elusimicrobia bacterium]|nr:Arc family DNA-binding protein [Elusimicrobiota bacterium]
MAKTKTIAYYLRLPLELHRTLVEQSKKERRSLAQEIIYLLEQALEKHASP